jgi:hypothetical protein
MEDDDWRLATQDRYLTGRELVWRKWSSDRPDWDHDHCDFCWAEFAAEISDHAPYDAEWVTADDGTTWVCAVCFEDFKERFRWTITGGA